MTGAIKALRRELRRFEESGLRLLLADLEAGRESPDRLPGRGTWNSCPLSYRMGKRGSCSTDIDGMVCNDFVEAWDGYDGNYFDEARLVKEVKDEMTRRTKVQRHKHWLSTRPRGKAVPR